MRLVYVAGPYRADNAWEIERNIREAEEIALELWKMGLAVICPHANTRFFQGTLPDVAWLNGDLEMIKRCDAVVFSPRWMTSEGAKQEREVCRMDNIKIFDWPMHKDYIEDWALNARRNLLPFLRPFRARRPTVVEGN